MGKQSVTARADGERASPYENDSICAQALVSEELIEAALESDRKVIIVENSKNAFNGELYTRLFKMAVDLGYVVLLVELDARDVADASPVFYMKTQCQAIFLKVGDGDAKDIESEVVRAQRRD